MSQRCTFMSMPHAEGTQTHIGPFLRHLRTTLGLSLREAAAVTHVDYGYLGRVERQQNTPTDVWITSYVKLLGQYRADMERAS